MNLHVGHLAAMPHDSRISEGCALGDGELVRESYLYTAQEDVGLRWLSARPRCL